MRRLLVVALAAALPALGNAQVNAPAGALQVVDTQPDNLIGINQCLGTAPVDVRWTMAPLPNQTIGGLGRVRIYASNKARPATTDDPRTCYLPDDSTSDTDLRRIQVTEFNDVQLLTNEQTIPAADIGKIRAGLGLDCNAGTSATAIYLCALPYRTDASTTHIGYANGNFTLDTTKPNPVSGVRAQSADRALVVSFSESDDGTNATDFRAEAVRADGSDPTVRSGTGNSSPVRIGGLTNEVEYAVRVIAISAAGNESDPFPGPDGPQVLGTPHPGEDFWEWYQRAGGVEEGGCATGAAGMLGLLGAAALLRIRRRKP